MHYEYTPMFTPKLLSIMLPIAVQGILPAYLALCSQVHFHEECHFIFHLTIAFIYASA